MLEIERKAQHRLMALDKTNKLQEEIGFDNKWRAFVEHQIYEVAEDCYRRGFQYPPEKL